MPLPPPVLDPRRYQELFDETLSRIPVHTPEWTNFNASDPGVTLAALFAFLTENSLHLLNRAPDNLQRTFLERLELELSPGAGAQGLVTISNERGPLETVTLDADLEVHAGQVPFRTTLGLDVLPIEGRAYFKKKVTPSEEIKAYYRSLFTSFLATEGNEQEDADLVLYETTALPPPNDRGVDLATESVDRALWIALLLPASVKPSDEPMREQIRRAIGGKTLSLGIAPVVDAEVGRVLGAGGAVASGANQTDVQLTVELPQVPPSRRLDADRQPLYRAVFRGAAPTTPSVLEVPLPSASELALWENLDPLEPGTGNFPPALEDSALEERRVTWLRIVFPEGAAARILWCGVNTVPIAQRKRVGEEVLASGSGRPDQKVTLANKPVIAGSVRLRVTSDGKEEDWSEVSNLASAGPEVLAPDPEHPPGTLWETLTRSEVFALDAEAGVLRFGDGLRGKRPPADSRLVASYDHSLGGAGNVRSREINRSPALPPGLTVNNALPTWGGANAESPEEGQKQVARWLQHRDRLVTAEDFRVIARRAPGLELGRIEVLPLYDPRLGASTEPGTAPGVVTLLVVPKHDPLSPHAPEPSAEFLRSLCEYLEPRRLLTTEVVVRGPVYLDLWVSVGIGVGGARATAIVKKSVEEAVRALLSPLPREDLGTPELSPLLTAPDPNAATAGGWPWRKAVTRGELVAAIARVPGVVSVLDVKLAAGDGPETEQVPMGPLNFPRLAGLMVATGAVLDLDQVRGTRGGTSGGGAGPRKRPGTVPVPVVPKEC